MASFMQEKLVNLHNDNPVHNDCAIVYCQYRTDTQSISQRLQLQGICSRSYHGGMSVSIIIIFLKIEYDTS